FVSRYVETMLDYTVEEWLSTPNFWLQLVHPDDREAAARTASEGFRNGLAHVNEFRWLAKDGRAVWCAAYSIAVKDERGAPVGMRGVTMDISDRKRAEESLRFLLKVSEALAETLETASSIEAVLKMSVPLLGDTAAADIEQENGTIRRIGASPLDESAAAAEWRKGSLAVLRGTVIAPLIARGRVIGGMSFTRTRAYAESEVHLIELLAKRAAVAIDNARLYQEARAANKAKDEFLASLSHELRTPMTATLGWVSLLRMTDFDRDQIRDAMDAIEQGTRTQARLIEDLLDISRIVTGKVEMYNERVDLAAVAQQAVETTLPAARAKQIRVDVGAPPEPVTLWGDGGRIKQVIWNLLSNAVKFTPPGGEVRIEIAREDSAARIRVTDSGEGISPEFLPRVFERFAQGSTGTNRRHGGLGLGLAIARSFVELHGGSIDAASEGSGKGSTFTVSLPAGGATVPARD
ncbi:MAG TPA: PAS domain-containing sensor histidine kinase, partial [Thermoanaerobaculia bacterium]|nr:PAS domain-containing sensor histidine kinase [Thermoanaerobaculia bacterium]